MTPNLLVFIFFALFLLFLAESIYFMRRKLGNPVSETANPDNNPHAGKYILAGVVAAIFLLIAGTYLFLSGKKTAPVKDTATQVASPTPIPPTPATGEVAYVLPTQIPLSPSPTLAVIVTITPMPSPTKKPSPTITPSPTTQPPKPTNAPTSGPIGGPDTVSPTMNQLPTSAAVVIPKLPVAGSAQQTLGIFFMAVSAILTGLIL